MRPSYKASKLIKYCDLQMTCFVTSPAENEFFTYLGFCALWRNTYGVLNIQVCDSHARMKRKQNLGLLWFIAEYRRISIRYQQFGSVYILSSFSRKNCVWTIRAPWYNQILREIKHQWLTHHFQFNTFLIHLDVL